MCVDEEVDNQAEVEVEMKLGEGGWLCKRLTGAKWWLRGLHASIGTSFHLSRRRRRSCSAEGGEGARCSSRCSARCSSTVQTVEIKVAGHWLEGDGVVQPSS